jgi:hypothetical protein
VQDPDFPSLSGARVVRIAVHPQLSGAGYGSRALEQLKRFFQVRPQQGPWAGTTGGSGLCVLPDNGLSGPASVHDAARLSLLLAFPGTTELPVVLHSVHLEGQQQCAVAPSVS